MEQSRNLTFEHLKAFSSTEGYWSTTDCIKIAEHILEHTKATSMLEIGFNIGYSASVWIESGIKNIFFIDVNYHKDTVNALYAVKDTYKDCKIDWLLADSKTVSTEDIPIDIDISFIDGEHSYLAAKSDSILSIEKGANWLVYDDVIEDHPNGIWQAITELEDEGKIKLEYSYPMTWIGQGYVVLCKVL